MRAQLGLTDRLFVFKALLYFARISELAVQGENKRTAILVALCPWSVETIPERCLVPFFGRQIFSTIALFTKQAHFIAFFFFPLAQTFILHKLDAIPAFGQSVTSKCLGASHKQLTASSDSFGNSEIASSMMAVNIPNCRCVVAPYLSG